MKFGVLQWWVKCCEQVVIVCLVEIQDYWFMFSQVWCQGWLLLCIVLVGLVGGFIVGKLEMLGKVNGVCWLQMVGLVLNLFVSVQVVFVMVMVVQVVVIVDDVVEEVDNVSEQVQVVVLVLIVWFVLVVVLWFVVELELCELCLVEVVIELFEC